MNLITNPSMIIAATDGSSWRGIAGAGVCFYNDGMVRRESFKVEGRGTNNRGELTAIMKCLELVEFSKGEILMIITDSEYSMKTLSTWTKYESREEILKRKNSDLILKIKCLIELRKSQGLILRISHVNSHLNRKGIKIDDLPNKKWLLAVLNEESDKLADYKNFQGN